MLWIWREIRKLTSKVAPDQGDNCIKESFSKKADGRIERLKLNKITSQQETFFHLKVTIPLEHVQPKCLASAVSYWLPDMAACCHLGVVLRNQHDHNSLSCWADGNLLLNCSPVCLLLHYLPLEQNWNTSATFFSVPLFPSLAWNLFWVYFLFSLQVFPTNLV